MEDILYRAIELFVEKDINLLRFDVHERTLAQHLAYHLKELLPDHDIDCEYNRNGMIAKRLKSQGYDDRLVLPDIIVHKRGTHENILVMEIKKNDSHPEDDDEDRRKLRAMVQDYGYRYAVFLKMFIDEKYPRIEPPEWIQK